MKKHIKYILPLCLCFFANISFAEIAPECAGVETPANYDEGQQQAFFQNYFSAAFGMTAMGPIIPIRGEHRASLGLELFAIPPLSCERRLVFAEDPARIKTQDTNKLPVSARPRLQVMLPDLGQMKVMFGGTFFPPIPTPLGTILQVGVETSVAREFDSGFQIGVHGHYSFGRMRAELAPPFEEGDPEAEDVFYTNYFGLDLGLAYNLKSSGYEHLTPYLNIGFADASSLFIVGDDLNLAQNTQHPWAGLTAATGLQMMLSDRIELGVELSAAFPVIYTGRMKIGLHW